MNEDFINFYVTPSIIQQYTLNKKWGINAWLKTLGLKKNESNFFTKFGNKLHNKLEYNNNRRFYTVFNVDDLNVFMEGTPDHLNPLKELKTCSYYKLANKFEREKIVEAAAMQLRGYMMLTGDEYGYVVLYCREGIVDEYSVVVHRDDESFKKKVKELYEELQKSFQHI